MVFCQGTIVVIEAFDQRDGETQLDKRPNLTKDQRAKLRVTLDSIQQCLILSPPSKNLFMQALPWGRP